MDVLKQLEEIKRRIEFAKRQVKDNPEKSLEVLMQIEGLVAALNGVEQSDDKVKELRMSVLADLESLISLIDQEKETVQNKLKGFAQRVAAAKGYGDKG